MHKAERYLTSNTTHLAKNTIEGINVLLHGMPEALQAEDIFIPGHKPLYLFPDEDAKTLTEYKQEFDRPFQLIVPDGSWRQAKKIKRRIPALVDIPSVKISHVESEYLLRKGPFAGALCTYEAMTYALKEIEGDVVFEKLIANFRVFNETFHGARNNLLSAQQTRPVT